MRTKLKLTPLMIIMALFLLFALAMSVSANDRVTTSSAVDNPSTSSSATLASDKALGAEIALTAADTNITGAFEAASADKGKILKTMVARAIQVNDYGKLLARKALIRSTALAAANKAAGTVKKSTGSDTITTTAMSPPAAKAVNTILQV